MDRKMMAAGHADAPLLRRVLVLYGPSDAPPCAPEDATGFERFMPVSREAFAASAQSDEDREAEWAQDAFCLPPALSLIRQSREPWVLLLWGTLKLDGDALFHIQHDLLTAPCEAAVYSERFAEDGAAIYMPRTMDRVPQDVFGAFPANLLIRRELLERALSRPRGVFLPNPIVGILREVLAMGVPVAGREAIGILHSGPMHCAVASCSAPHGDSPKRILIMTHELSRTGAPIVLAEACINALKPAGCDLLAVSPSDGPMRQTYLDAGIPVMLMPSVMDESCAAIATLALLYDLTIVNTIVLWTAIRALDAAKCPVLWWIHDAELGYRWVERYMPDRLGPTTHVYSVGDYAIATLKRHKPQYEDIRSLIYGIRDVGDFKAPRPAHSGERTVFVCAGSIEERKGQDILCRAIELLPEDIRRLCLFRIVGRTLSESVLSCVQRTCRRFPEQVEYHREMPREEIYRMYAQADCIICASRDDPMPTFVAEGMMFGTPSICSENTGTAGVLTHGVDGLVYAQNSPELLSEAIRAFLSLSSEERAQMSRQARLCFLRVFELQGFKTRLIEATAACIGEEASEDARRICG